MLVVFSVVFHLFDRADASVGQRLWLPVLALVMVSPLVCVTGAGAAGNCSFGVTLIGGFLGIGLGTMLLVRPRQRRNVV